MNDGRGLPAKKSAVAPVEHIRKPQASFAQSLCELPDFRDKRRAVPAPTPL